MWCPGVVRALSVRPVLAPPSCVPSSLVPRVRFVCALCPSVRVPVCLVLVLSRLRPPPLPSGLFFFFF